MLIIPRWKAVVILLVALAGLLYAAPNLLPRQVAESLPNWLPHQQVSLGLDLQGGSHLLLEVDTAFVVRERIANLQDVVRTAFRQPQIGYADLAARDDAVTFTLRDPTKVEEARRLLREGRCRGRDRGRCRRPLHAPLSRAGAERPEAGRRRPVD